MKAGDMRHRVRVLRPAKAVGTLGETQGKPEVVFNEWPCSIKTLSGKEQEAARQNGADATLQVEGYGDPTNPIDEQCYLEFGERKLNIAAIIDEHQNGIELRLLCGELK